MGKSKTETDEIPTTSLDECGSSHECRMPNKVNMDQTHNHPATSGVET